MRCTWWYLSFADRDRFLGACFVETPMQDVDMGMMAAIVRAHALQINPGGEVMGTPIPHDLLEGQVEPEHRERLLSRAEIDTLWGAAPWPT